MLTDDPVYLTKAAADFMGLSAATLQKWRSEGGGPEFVVLGRRRIGYRASSIQRFLADRVATSAADARERGLSSSAPAQQNA